MAAPLTGLGSRPSNPDLPRCACGCGRAGPRGFPGDVHYAHTCVPPRLRFPWEPGYAAPEPEAPPPAPAAAHDLLSGLAPA